MALAATLPRPARTTCSLPLEGGAERESGRRVGVRCRARFDSLAPLASIPLSPVFGGEGRVRGRRCAAPLTRFRCSSWPITSRCTRAPTSTNRGIWRRAWRWS